MGTLASSGLTLDAAALVALAELPSVAWRTVFTGTSSLLDCLVICPGLHRQQDAIKLNSGEYPICAAMTTGYVFRVENQATEAFLQQLGRPGHLTRLSVSSKGRGLDLTNGDISSSDESGYKRLITTVCYSSCILLTVVTLAVLYRFHDWWATLTMCILIGVRVVNVIVIKRRSVEGWKGEPEPGQRSDLIVLASQDRWIRIQGEVDDVKAITSGQWMRDLTFVENAFVGFATLLSYLNVALARNASTTGKVLLLLLLFCSAGLLGLANECTHSLKMCDRSVKVVGHRAKYKRRLELAEQLIKETGKKEWAFKLGMIQPSRRTSTRNEASEPASNGGESQVEGNDTLRGEYSVIREL